MKLFANKLFNILKSIFFITDRVVSSILYAYLILSITVLVWTGFGALAENYHDQFIWELSIFAFTFFSVFYFFIQDKKYSFNEYVIVLVPVSALLLLMGIGLAYVETKNGNEYYEKIGTISLYSGMLFLAFALSHTTILICRNQINK